MYLFICFKETVTATQAWKVTNYFFAQKLYAIQIITNIFNKWSFSLLVIYTEKFKVASLLSLFNF